MSSYIFFTNGARLFRARKIDGKITEFQEQRRHCWHKVNCRYIQEVLDCYKEFIKQSKSDANQVLKEAQKDCD